MEAHSTGRLAKGAVGFRVGIADGCDEEHPSRRVESPCFFFQFPVKLVVPVYFFGGKFGKKWEDHGCGTKSLNVSWSAPTQSCRANFCSTKRYGKLRKKLKSRYPRMQKFLRSFLFAEVLSFLPPLNRWFPNSSWWLFLGFLRTKNSLKLRVLLMEEIPNNHLKWIKPCK